MCIVPFEASKLLFSLLHQALCPSPPPTQKGGTASPASSQTGSGESAGEQQRREQSVADAVSALHLGSHPQPAAQHLASPPQTPDPKQRLENGGPSAPVTPAMHQPQPPSTPPTGRSGRSKRGTRRNKSLSQNNLAGGSSEGSGSNPAFQVGGLPHCILTLAACSLSNACIHEVLKVVDRADLHRCTACFPLCTHVPHPTGLPAAQP